MIARITLRVLHLRQHLYTAASESSNFSISFSTIWVVGFHFPSLNSVGFLGGFFAFLGASLEDLLLSPKSDFTSSLTSYRASVLTLFALRPFGLWTTLLSFWGGARRFLPTACGLESAGSFLTGETVTALGCFLDGSVALAGASFLWTRTIFLWASISTSDLL